MSEYDDFTARDQRPTSDFNFAVYSALPDTAKRDLCVRLLEEFGVSQFEETTRGELRHKCTLPLGGHTDRNSTTASINYLKLTFRCLVCDNRGGLLWWIATNRRESSADAVEWLANQSGIATDGSMELETLLAILREIANPTPKVVEPIPRLDPRVLEPWSHERWGMFHPYLTGPWTAHCREIPEENLKLFKVGYCDADEDWHYRQRIIIPVFWDDALVGWQARKLDPADPMRAKYINSPGFPRYRVLYGAHLTTLRRPKDIVLVESPMSVLRHAHHLPMVATFGKAVAEEQLAFLHRFRRVTVWFDNDKAGWEAISGKGTGKSHLPGLIERLSPYTEVRVVQSPYDVDPADMTESEAAELVSGAVPWPSWRRPETLVAYRRAA